MSNHISAKCYRLIGHRDVVLDDVDLCFEGSGLLIETLFSAVSPGTELAAFNGVEPLRPTTRSYPRYMGYCNIGRVVAAGGDVDDLLVGDVVLSNLSHRSHAIIGRDQVLCSVPKEETRYAELSTTYLFNLGYLAFLKANVSLGGSLAVVGFGTLGACTTSVAAKAGVDVSVFSDKASESDVQSFGGGHLFKKSPLLKDASSHFDAVIYTGTDWTDWKLALELVRVGGVIVCLGFPGRGQSNPSFNPLHSEFFYDKQLTIKSCGHVPTVDHPKIDCEFTLPRNCSFISEQILADKLPATAIIECALDFSELPGTYAEMTLSRNGPRTRVLQWLSDL